jgi:hypothetical protein
MSKTRNKSDEKNKDERMEKIKQNLTCSVLKTNYIDDPKILLGYPIVHSKSRFNPNKIELYPIPEMLSYEGFIGLVGNQEDKLEHYFDTHFKSSNSQNYNCWIPVYINKEHYENNKTHVLNSFSIIKYGPEGKKEYDFKPQQIFEILPIVLNKMIIGMFNGKVEISSAFIISYFQYVLLFKKLSLEFEEDNLEYLNRKLSLIYDNNYNIDKKIIPDIGNFFMILFYCNKDTHEESMKKMWNCLFEEFLARQMSWLFHGDETKKKMKRLVLKNIVDFDETCLTKFENDPGFKMRHIDKFNDDLNKLKLFDQVVDIISKDEKYLNSLLIRTDNTRDYVVKRMAINFKSLFNQCSDEAKNELKKIIKDNLHFYDYFEYDIKNELYDNYKVSEIFKNEKISNEDEIIKYAYESQRGNQLLLITFFAQKKIEEKGFLEELEKNYGVYLDVDNFIQEMNKKLDEIKSIKKLFEFIGCDFGKDKTEIELMIEAYDRAKEKGYLQAIDNSRTRNSRDNININRSSSSNNYRRQSRGGSYRGRGYYRGRGRGRGRDRGSGLGRGRSINRFGRGRGFSRGRGFYRNRNEDGRRVRERSRDRDH